MEIFKSVTTLTYTMMFVIAVEVAFILAVVLIKIMKNQIDISGLLNEPDGKASLSRFQFFVFTFVIAGLYLLLCIENGQFIEIPNSVLGLLGISGGSYLVSKSIGPKPPVVAVVGAPAAAPPPATPPAGGI